MPTCLPGIACSWPNSIMGNDEEQAGLIWDEEPKSHCDCAEES